MGIFSPFKPAFSCFSQETEGALKRQRKSRLNGNQQNQKNRKLPHINALALWVNFSSDDSFEYFLIFARKQDLACHARETICMKCPLLFSGKNKKNLINLSSAELAKRVVKVK